MEKFYKKLPFSMKIIQLENVETEFREEDSMSPFVIPTETVYGLAARIDNDNIINDVFKIKGRPSDNPLIVHISSLEMLDGLIKGEILEEYKILIEKFWPGPLSLIFKANDMISQCIRGNNSDTVAIRMPSHPMLRKLIDEIGVPLAAPSANTSGRPSPTNVQHVIDDFGEKVKVYVDGGPSEVGIESTVFGVVDSQPIILRPGGVTREQIEEALQMTVAVKNTIHPNESILCPGQKYKHYSPSIPVYLFKGLKWRENMKKIREDFKKKRIGLIGASDMAGSVEASRFYNLGNNKKEFAQKIFDGLIEFEKCCDIIFIREFSLHDEGLAIMDRLGKAATYVIE